MKRHTEGKFANWNLRDKLRVKDEVGTKRYTEGEETNWRRRDKLRVKRRRMDGWMDLMYWVQYSSVLRSIITELYPDRHRG